MTLPLILRTVLIAETLDAPDTDGLQKAATAYAKVIRKKPRDLLDLGVAAFNPELPSESELLAAPEQLLYDKAPAISSRFKDRPVALVRAVIVRALYDLLNDPQLGSLLYLNLVDTLQAQTEPGEQALRADFIERARDTYLAAAKTAWNGTSDVAPPGEKGFTKTATVSPSKVQYSTVNVDELNEGISTAVRNGQAMTTSYHYNEKWVDLFTPALAKTLSTTINQSVGSVASSINASLGKTVAALDAKLAEIQTTQEHQRRQERQANILWWLQVKYSPEQERPYRELDVATGAAQIAIDAQHFMPHPVPPHVEAVINEAVRSAYAEADTAQPIWPTLQALTTLRGRTTTHATRTLWAWTGRTANAAEFESSTGVKADTSITPVAMALWLFRQAQAERLT